nr:MAG TPA: hypothetical protein [Caudoviricetes sp.]
MNYFFLLIKLCTWSSPWTVVGYDYLLPYYHSNDYLQIACQTSVYCIASVLTAGSEYLMDDHFY